MHAPQIFLFSVLFLGMAELVIWKGVNPISFSRTFDAVERDDVLVTPAKFELGDVAIGEKRRLRVEITNQKSRAITLRQPESGCGCIRFTMSKPLEILSGETVELAIEYTAPKVPAKILKSVLLRVATADESWRLPLTGQVVADSWANPASHYISEDEREVGRVHFAEDRRVANVVISNPEKIRVSLLTPSSNSQPYRIELTEEIHGDGEFVAFFDEEEDCLATVPVKWRDPGVIACKPNLVVLDPVPHIDTESFDVVVLRNVDETDLPSIEVLVDWAQVVSREDLTDKVMKFSVEVDRKRSPNNFEGPMIRVSDRRTGQVAQVKGQI